MLILFVFPFFIVVLAMSLGLMKLMNRIVPYVQLLVFVVTTTRARGENHIRSRERKTKWVFVAAVCVGVIIGKCIVEEVPTPTVRWLAEKLDLPSSQADDVQNLTSLVQKVGYIQTIATAFVMTKFITLVFSRTLLKPNQTEILWNVVEILAAVYAIKLIKVKFFMYIFSTLCLLSCIR